jgi:preprotein translocase subunit SecE
MSWLEKSRNFLAETRAEMKKVTFPSRDEVVATTMVVLVASFVFAVYLWLADLVIVKVYDAILNFFV